MDRRRKRGRRFFFIYFSFALSVISFHCIIQRSSLHSPHVTDALLLFLLLQKENTHFPPPPPPPLSLAAVEQMKKTKTKTKKWDTTSIPTARNERTLELFWIFGIKETTGGTGATNQLWQRQGSLSSWGGLLFLSPLLNLIRGGVRTNIEPPSHGADALRYRRRETAAVILSTCQRNMNRQLKTHHVEKEAKLRLSCPAEYDSHHQHQHKIHNEIMSSTRGGGNGDEADEPNKR